MDAFTADDLIECYRLGIFPMADARDDPRIFLVEPQRRGVIPLDGFHVSRRLARTVASDRFEVRTDTAFGEVIALCAGPRREESDTWINGVIEGLCLELFQRGYAHSVECWRDGRLVGGLYGVSLGGAFFGESMFSLETDASKVALVHLVGRLRAGGYALLDTQFVTAHLTQFGTIEIPRADYKERLAQALVHEGDWSAIGAATPGGQLLQLMTQAS